MAVHLSANNRGGRRRRMNSISEINITPFVDVMLVLLVIFMVTAPLMTVGIPVDLPKTEASSINEKTEPLTITVTKNGTIFLQESELKRDALIPRLKAITGENANTRIFVRGDQSIAYGEIVSVMGAVSSAGFSKVALLADLPQAKTKNKRS